MLEGINAALYILALLIYYKKRRRVDTYFVLLASYVFTAVMCFLYSNTGESIYTNVTIFRYFYLFVCIIVSLSPYAGFNLTEKRLLFREAKLVRALAWIYMLTGILSLFYLVPSAINLVSSGDWYTVRQMAYNNEVQATGGFLEYLLRNLHGYLNPFGIVMCFYYLNKPKEKKYFVYLIWISWLACDVLSGFAIASRSMAATLLLSVLVIFFLYKDTLPRRVIAFFIITMILFAIPISLYMVSVSVSRFGDSEVGNSVFFYLGHAMPAFNDAVMGSMHSYAWGDYSLSQFYNLLGISSTINDQALGLKLNGAFMTFVGGYYIDFGPVFTLVFIAVITSFLSRFTHKRNLYLSDMVIIIAFARIYIEGNFYIASGYLYAWFFTYIVYKLVRLAERSSKNYAKIHCILSSSIPSHSR